MRSSRLAYTQMLQAVNIPLDAPFIQDELPLKEKALRDFFATQGYFAAAIATTFQVDDAHKIVNIAFDCNMNKRARSARSISRARPMRKRPTFGTPYRLFGLALNALP